VALVKPTDEEGVRETLESAGIDPEELQQVSDPEFGDNVFQIQTRTLEPDRVDSASKALDDEYGIVANGFDSTSVGPTFGQQVANSALKALIFSLLVICAYIAFRFDPKFAVPVVIAIFHDILITAGVYSLTGREVTSGTIAAFLTILGYSLYDTIIVFDRIRENMPRMPRAAFSQIVNRSMSEVLTRSLATSFTTLLGVMSLLIFGGVTLQDFAFAMGVGILSGTYSSIFIASPVLTAWKEREPGFARRRERIAQLDGTVPAFADEVELAKLTEDDGEGEVDGVDSAAEPEVRPPAAAVATAEPGDGGPGASANGEQAAAEKASAERRRRNAERRERRQQRRKHGRNR
jgi:SecD/SecF fusion protein